MCLNLHVNKTTNMHIHSFARSVNQMPTGHARGEAARGREGGECIGRCVCVSESVAFDRSQLVA